MKKNDNGQWYLRKLIRFLLDHPLMARIKSLPATAHWMTLTKTVQTATFWVGCFCIGTLTSAVAQAPPADFSTAVIGSNWNQAIGLTFTSNGQVMFVWEKGGTVWTVVGNVKSASPLLDISEEVGNWRDHGLVSMALDPNFSATGGYIYLFYAVDRHHLLNYGTAAYNPKGNEYYNATIARLTRYTVQGNGNNFSVDLNSRKILLGETKSTGIVITHESHGAGALAFGSDGTLLLTAGDGAGYVGVDVGGGKVGVDNYDANDSIAYEKTYARQALLDGILMPTENVGTFRSQLLTSLNGKVLRIDPATGDGIPSNPYFDASKPHSVSSRVWGLGLRNSYRMTRRPDTGSKLASAGNPGVFYLGEVGWGLWEELNVCHAPGLNFGWPLFEGLQPASGYPLKATRNQTALNPLSNGSSCPAYFSFKDLLKQPVQTGQPSFLNPCNSAQAIPTQYTFVHTRPTLDWKHGPGPSRVGTFAGNAATITNVGAVGSPTNGSSFGGNASTAGIWYTGDDFPSKYKNTYFHADYGAGWIRNFQLDGSDQLYQINNFIDSGLSMVCLATNPTSGGLYYIQYGGDPFVNEVRKVYFSANHPPQAQAQSNKSYGPGPLLVNFTSTGTTDQDGGALTYQWDFGDGSVSADANPVHTFAAPAGVPTRYTVTFTVTDAQAASSTVALVISVNNTPPSVQITSPVNNSLYPLNGTKLYNLTATVTDTEQTASELTYQWQTILHHNNHEHPDPFDTNPATTTEISPVGCDGETYYFRVVLKVTDAAGLSSTSEVKLYPDCQSLAPNITAINATSANTQVSLNWKNPTVQFDEIMIVAKPNASITASPSGNGAAYTADLSYAGAGSAFDGGKVVYKGTGTPQTILNLVNNTPYFFKIFVRTSTYWSSGVEIKAIPGCTAPSVQASSLSFSSISTHAMALSWVNGSGTGRIAKINTVSAFTSPANGISPAANTVYQGSGEQVIYNGSGSTVNITGLLPGITYYVKVYEYSCMGSAMVYAANTSNPASQSTNSSSCTATGTLLQEIWANISGTAVSSIPLDLPPTSNNQVDIFQGSTVVSSRYGARYRGYLCVPNSGKYTFWISSDNDSELWLSTDSFASNKVKIAYILDGFSYANQWTKYPSQQSAPMVLEAGKRYYVEALHKQDGGGDNFMVGWQLPAGSMERPITGIRFSPFILPVITTVEEAVIAGNTLTVHPNPFSTKATIEVTLEKPTPAQLQLYDLRGAMLKSFFEGQLAGKTHRFDLDGRLLSEGIYIIQLTTPNGVIHQKVVLYK